MSQQYQLRPDRSRAALLEAVEAGQHATLSWQTEQAWQLAKARFVSVDADECAVGVRLAANTGCELPEVGQELSVSFRNGSRKYVFTTCLVERPDAMPPIGKPGVTLRLSWPEVVHEMQRRLYHRTPVPPGRFIPVDLWLAQARESEPIDAPTQQGKMVDLSAGGVSVELPRQTRPRWREDDQFTCRFSTGPDRPPVEVTARLTNYTRLPQGHVRVGLQFLGLDAGERGRHALQQINLLTSRLRRS